MTDILYLPLDERPCNRLFADKICRISDEYRLIAPKRAILGDKKIPADYAEIRNFLLENVARAKAAVLSLDMLLYGGIVPSRLHHLQAEELGERLSLLSELKERNKDLKLYAFALIMRCPSYSSADEEPDYYEFCGREIFLIGQIKHKAELGVMPQDRADEYLKEYARSTGAHLADYERRRAVNFSMLERILAELGKSIDVLVFPQDDSSEYGYTASDREKLKRIMEDRGIAGVEMYPGADEVGMTLLARAVCEDRAVTPTICPIYPVESAADVVPLYEDRPVGKTLSCMIRASGCAFADRGGADILLYMNYPAAHPVLVGEKPTDGYAERNVTAFANALSADARRGKTVALADGAYCNGGDVELLKEIGTAGSLFTLSAYAGWNTSSNTLGTAIAAAIFVFLFGKSGRSEKFLAERIYEDAGYCGYVRGKITEEVLPATPYNYFDVKEEQGEVADLVKEELQRFISDNFPEVAEKYQLKSCKMPWRRMFETEITLTERG